MLAAPLLGVGAAAPWQAIVGVAILSVLEPRGPRVLGDSTDAKPGAPSRGALRSPWGGAQDRVR